MTLPPLSTPSTTPSSPLPTPTSSSVQRLSFSSSTLDEPQQNRFIYRVSNIPIVNSAIRVYEHSKNSSSVVKYGAEMVESFAGPIYDKLGKPVLSNVDEWGCKQLDKVRETTQTHNRYLIVINLYLLSWKKSTLICLKIKRQTRMNKTKMTPILLLVH